MISEPETKGLETTEVLSREETIPPAVLSRNGRVQ